LISDKNKDKYNLATEDELAKIKWPKESKTARTMGANMDISSKKGVNQNG